MRLIHSLSLMLRLSHITVTAPRQLLLLAMFYHCLRVNCKVVLHVIRLKFNVHLHYRQYQYQKVLLIDLKDHQKCSTLRKEAALYCKLVTVGLPVQVPVTAKVVAGEMVLAFIVKAEVGRRLHLLIVLPAVHRHIKVIMNVIVHATTQPVIMIMEIAVNLIVKVEVEQRLHLLIVLPAVHRHIKVTIFVIVLATTQPVIMITETAVLF